MPMLSRVETTGDNSATFRLTFVHVAAGHPSQSPAQERRTRVHSLNLAHRFRWEIIDPYRDPDRLQERVRRQGIASDGGGALSTVWEAIRLLEVEAENRGVFAPQTLPADFGRGAEARVREMFEIWEQYREQPKRAASEDDAAAFSRVLSKLDSINVEFISLAAQRLGELVRADASHH